MVSQDAVSAQHEQRRPNVILLMADQLRADALGYAGNPIVRTPNLDRLAAGGIVFEHMFVQTPVCMASRGSIFTGRYPRSIRVRSMGVLPPTEITLAEELQRAGYATGLMGKLHFTPMGFTLQQLKTDYETNDATPYLEASGILSSATRAAVEDPFKKDYGFQVSYGVGDLTWGHYLDWLGQMAPEHVQDHVAENWGMGRNGVRYGDSPPASRVFHPTVTDFFDSHLPAEVHPSAFIVERTLEFARANRDRPWFAHTSFVDPHHPFNAPVPYNRIYRPEEMPVPPTFQWERCFPPGLPAAVVAQIERFAAFPDEVWQWARANYYGMVSHIDWCVGTLLDGLEALGLADNTLIVFTADHGEYVGDHCLLYKGSLHFDGLMRVPFVVSWPGRLQPRRVRAMVQQIDIYPTVLSLLGRPIHAGVQGKDLSGMLRGEPEEGYQRVTCELDQLPSANYVPSHTIRSEEWKLEYFPLARTGMLFNLRDDPGERHNLCFDPGCQKVRSELYQDLIDHLYATKDPLPIRLSQA